jgi:hypothetical protein
MTVAVAATPLPADLSERDFQRAVIDLARTLGWDLIAHFRPAMNARGHHQTPVGADGAGYPDLHLTHRDGREIFAELKSRRGVLTVEQERWLQRLWDCGHLVYVWRPVDWPDIVEALA